MSTKSTCVKTKRANVGSNDGDGVSIGDDDDDDEDHHHITINICVNGICVTQFVFISLNHDW